MSIVVEHEKRRREILEKALGVFIDEGYEDVTFQKIADRCDITRTTLYIYFKNKREIFNYSIKQLLQDLEGDISRIREEKLPHTEKLIKVMSVIIDRLEENHLLLSVICGYLLHISKGDIEPDKRVRRRTVRLRHILATMIIDGIRAGEFAEINVKTANELLYSLLESAVFRMVVLKRAGAGELKDAMILTVRRLAAESVHSGEYYVESLGSLL
jgi:AcrR family transcriptional regulator